MFLNVRVCSWVIRLTSDPPPALLSYNPTISCAHQAPPHCLSRAWLSPLQLLAPGLLLKCIIEWAELVGSSESSTESHTQFMFLHESHSDCFCFISLTNCPGFGMLKMGVDWSIMSVLCAVCTVFIHTACAECTVLLDSIDSGLLEGWHWYKCIQYWYINVSVHLHLDGIMSLCRSAANLGLSVHSA